MTQAEIERAALERLAKNNFIQHNPVSIRRIEADYAVVEMDVRPDTISGFGVVHGGAIFMMADNAAGYAALSDGRDYRTQEGSIHYLRNVSSGVLVAEAFVAFRSRKTCLVNVDIYCGDTPIAQSTFTFFCVDKL